MRRLAPAFYQTMISNPATPGMTAVVELTDDDGTTELMDDDSTTYLTDD